jgi:ABC-type glutathione transport system ATPase component
MVNKDAQYLLRVTDLTIAYAPRSIFRWGNGHGRIAVDRVSFNVRKGETLALVGESGSGKTSIAMAILGFIRSLGGRIEFAGVPVDNRSMAGFRPRIQPLFQDSGAALNPQLTVGRAISDGLKAGWPLSRQRSRVLELMEMVELPESLYNHYPRQLSGGQKQRVCLARALAVEAEMLILDEPFSAQDIFHQMQMMRLMQDLKTTLGLTYLLISHDLMPVRLLADRIAILRDGKILETGTGDKIFSQPQNDYTRELILKAGIQLS